MVWRKSQWLLEHTMPTQELPVLSSHDHFLISWKATFSSHMHSYEFHLPKINELINFFCCCQATWHEAQWVNAMIVESRVIDHMQISIKKCDDFSIHAQCMHTHLLVYSVCRMITLCLYSNYNTCHLYWGKLVLLLNLPH